MAAQPQLSRLVTLTEYVTDAPALVQTVDAGASVTAGAARVQLAGGNVTFTTAPAERWQESQQRGRVEPGLAADLVVLGGDPAEDVKSFADVRCVFRSGKLIYSAAEGLASEKP